MCPLFVPNLHRLLTRTAGSCRRLRELRHRAEPSDAAGRCLERQLGTPDEVPGGECIARAGRVDDLGDREGRLLVAGERAASGAALDDPGSRRQRVVHERGLLLVREHDFGCESLDEPPESGDARPLDGAPGREIDAHASPVEPCELRRAYGRRGDGLRQQRVAGDVEVIAAEPVFVQLVGAQQSRNAAIGKHRSRPVDLRERDDDAARPLLDGTTELDTPRKEELGRETSGRIVAALAEPTRLGTEGRDPGRHVGALSTGVEPDPRGRIRVARASGVGLDDDIDREIPERDDPHLYDRRMARADDHGERRGRRARLRSFVLGGLVGASAVAAALRRARRRRTRSVQTGLGAFETAPCYRELLERERNDGP